MPGPFGFDTNRNRLTPTPHKSPLRLFKEERKAQAEKDLATFRSNFQNKEKIRVPAPTSLGSDSPAHLKPAAAPAQVDPVHEEARQFELGLRKRAEMDMEEGTLVDTSEEAEYRLDFYEDTEILTGVKTNYHRDAQGDVVGVDMEFMFDEGQAIHPVFGGVECLHVDPRTGRQEIEYLGRKERTILEGEKADTSLEEMKAALMKTPKRPSILRQEIPALEPAAAGERPVSKADQDFGNKALTHTLYSLPPENASLTRTQGNQRMRFYPSHAVKKSVETFALDDPSLILSKEFHYHPGALTHPEKGDVLGISTTLAGDRFSIRFGNGETLSLKFNTAARPSKTRKASEFEKFALYNLRRNRE